MTRRGTFLVGILASLALTAPAASAATFDVTRFDDPAPDACAPGDCSLREAVIAANGDPGSTINVPAGRYVLSIPNTPPVGDQAALEGDLDLRENMTINGAGAGITTVDGARLDRVFDLPHDVGEGCFEPDRQVTITGLTITNGLAEFNEDGKLFGGGGIVVCGQLTLNRSVVSGNEAIGGGGGLIVANNSRATIDDSTVTANKQGGNQQPGGARSS